MLVLKEPFVVIHATPHAQIEYKFIHITLTRQCCRIPSLFYSDNLCACGTGLNTVETRFVFTLNLSSNKGFQTDDTGSTLTLFLCICST